MLTPIGRNLLMLKVLSVGLMLGCQGGFLPNKHANPQPPVSTQTPEISPSAPSISGFLTDEDFVVEPPIKLDQVVAKAVLSSINIIGNYYYTGSEDLTSCAGRLFSATKVKVVGDVVSFNFADDGMICAETTAAPSDKNGVTIVRDEQHDSYSAHCDAENLNLFDGMTLGEIAVKQSVDAADFCQKLGGKNAESIENSWDQVTFTLASDPTKQQYKATTVHAVVGHDSAGCIKKFMGDTMILNNCKFMEKDLSTAQTTPSISVSAIISSSMVLERSQSYPTSGSLDFKIGSWDGTMSFNPASAPPSIQFRELR